VPDHGFSIVGAGDVVVGRRTVVHPGAEIVFHSPATVTIGDYCTVGREVKLVVDGGDVTIGDWTSLHDRCLVLSSRGVTIGEHGWFGQHTVLDGTGGLTVGTGVRVGMYSQIWSHVAAGEQIEGCTLYGTREVVLEDDVWLVGSCIVASGVRVGRRTIALIASNITKSCEPFSVLAGSPAVTKPNLKFYVDLSIQARWEMLSGWIDKLAGSSDLHVERADGVIEVSWANRRREDRVVIVSKLKHAERLLAQPSGATVCCLENKRYTKKLTDLEHKVLKYLGGNKARFLSWDYRS
jgi:acetyltransferase-like isoleucine patch superfamily enzyme